MHVVSCFILTSKITMYFKKTVCDTLALKSEGDQGLANRSLRSPEVLRGKRVPCMAGAMRPGRQNGNLKVGTEKMYWNYLVAHILSLAIVCKVLAIGNIMLPYIEHYHLTKLTFLQIPKSYQNKSLQQTPLPFEVFVKHI